MVNMYPECLWCWRISTWVVEHGMVLLLVPEVFPPVDFSPCMQNAEAFLFTI